MIDKKSNQDMIKSLALISLFVFCSCCFENKSVKEIDIVKEYYENGQLKNIGATIGTEKIGYWITYDNEGNKESEATYYNGVLNGVFIIYFKNGQKKMEANMINDLYHGYRKNFYFNGQVKSEGYYFNGNLNGVWISYDEYGRIDKKIEYREGKLIEIIVDNKLSPPLP